MNNPIMNAMLTGNMPQINNNLVQRFMQFRNTFRGNPQQQVEALLKSGRVTQEQYNNAVQMAKQLQNMLK